MANNTGREAKRISRRCLTRVKVTTPTAPRTPLPTKFAVAEKHMERFLSCEDYTGCRNLVIQISCQYPVASTQQVFSGKWVLGTGNCVPAADRDDNELHTSRFETPLHFC